MLYPELSAMFKEHPIKRPHVVILGAGASKATCNFDKNGKPLPTMDELYEVLGLEAVLKQYGVDFKKSNFEELCSSLYEFDKYKELMVKIESLVFGYFSSLRLPDKPTIYDYLILSLRPKDFIATFNWDPLLFQAFLRCEKVLKSSKMFPHLLFLHGSVSLGCCKEHLLIAPFTQVCPDCEKRLEQMDLLYPIKKKNYQDRSIIQAQWDDLQKALKNAFLITFFGYGAPVSDVEALKLMQEAYQNNEGRKMIETEIIDIKDREELAKRWSPFYYSSHVLFWEKFQESYIYKYPRRSCEAMWLPTVDGKFAPREKEKKQVETIEELVEEFKPLIEEELE